MEPGVLLSERRKLSCTVFRGLGLAIVPGYPTDLSLIPSQGCFYS